MSLSRTESFRRLPRVSRLKWLIVGAGFIAFVIVSFVLYIRSADSEYRLAERKAINMAIQQGGLVDADNATIHTWDETVWVVEGTDASGEKWMIWVRAEELVKLKVSDNVSESQMLSRFAETHDGKSPVRMLPGWFQDQPAWEVRYWSEIGKRHQAIDFYAFKDGSKLKTYELPVR